MWKWRSRFSLAIMTAATAAVADTSVVAAAATLLLFPMLRLPLAL